jgi:hypothetical protein
MTSDYWAEEMRGTRYHEAGHAVAAYYNGYTITRVSATDEDWRTSYRPLASGGGWADLWREGCVIMAGSLAERYAAWGEMRPEPWAEFLVEAEQQQELVIDGEDWMHGEYSDLLQLLQQMSTDRMGPQPEWAYRKPEWAYRIVEGDSRRLVTDHWVEIEAVAGALERKGALDGPEVMLIIERASRSDESAQG